MGAGTLRVQHQMYRPNEHHIVVRDVLMATCRLHDVTQRTTWQWCRGEVEALPAITRGRRSRWYVGSGVRGESLAAINAEHGVH